MNIYQQTIIKPQWLGFALIALMFGVLATNSFLNKTNQLEQDQVAFANEILFGDQMPFGAQMSLIDEALDKGIITLLESCHPTLPCYRVANNCIYVWGPKIFQHCP